MKLGGQAVIEGVMMRNMERFAIAVRLPNGKIRVKKERLRKLPESLKLPFIRGVVGLIFTLMDGIKALTWSSNQQLGKEEKMTPKEFVGTLALSLLVGVIIFIGVPFLIAQLLTKDTFWFNMIDGLLRAAVFVGYIIGISFLPDVQRLYQYHGAEHKAIACYEAGKSFDPHQVQQHSRIHPRCGTAFLFLVFLLSILLFSFIPGAWWVKLAGRILLMPVVAGISYELLKLGDRYRENIVLRALVAPGMWLQQITTKEPSRDQIEVAITALQGVVAAPVK